jgi:hypothetical protein
MKLIFKAVAMKKSFIPLLLPFFCLGIFLAGCSPRQAASTTGTETSTTGMTEGIRVPGPSSFSDYEGRYRVENAEFEYLTIEDENDQLHWQISEENKGVLQPGTVQDQFLVPTYNGKVTFIRSNDNEVTGIRIEYNGNTLNGQKVD